MRGQYLDCKDEPHTRFSDEKVGTPCHVRMWERQEVGAAIRLLGRQSQHISEMVQGSRTGSFAYFAPGHEHGLRSHCLQGCSKASRA